ncbi:MAG TPA: hypothetical protein VF974_07565 [Patescibacteria group bacterium]
MKTKTSVYKWRINNYEEYKRKAREHDREYYYRIRNELYILLGDKCCKCGFKDRRAFQIDHVNGGGNSRKIRNRTGQGKIRHMLEHVRNGSKDYQLLCANCNVIKKWENHEIKGHITKTRKEFITGVLTKIGDKL